MTEPDCTRTGEEGGAKCAVTSPARRLPVGILAVAALGAVLAGVMVRLGQGPVPLGFLRPVLEQVLSWADLGIEITLEDALLSWAGPDGRPELLLLGVRAKEPHGSLLVTVPRMAVKLEARALLRGRLLLGRLDVFGIRLKLGRERDGGIVLVAPSGEARAARPLPLSGSALGRSVDPASLAKWIRRIRLVRSDVALEDRSSGSSWRISEADLRVWPNGAGLDGTLEAVLATADEPIRLEASLGLRKRRTLELDRVRIRQGPMAADLRAVISIGELGTGIRATGRFGGLAVSDLGRHWPPNVAQSAREWILANVHAGTFPAAEFTVNLAPGDSDRKTSGSVTVDFRFQGLSADYFRPLPPLETVKGSARLTEHRLDLEVEAGRVGALEVSDGRLRIEDFADPLQTATISVGVNGRSADVLALIDQEPLRLATRLGIEPAKVGGTSSVRGRFHFPLSRNLTPADVEVAATADLHDAAIPGGFQKLDLDRGELHVDVDRQRLEVTGHASLNGVPLGLAWREAFAPRESSDRHYRLYGVVDERDLRALGWDTSPFLTGPVDLDLTLEPGTNTTGELKADLTATRIAIEELSWTKPAREPGRARLSFRRRRDGSLVVAPLVIEAGDLHVGGTVTIEGGRVTFAEGTGVFPGGAEARIELRESSGIRRLKLVSQDAGSALRATGLFRDAVGGHMQLDATIEDEGALPRLSGRLVVEDFKVVRAPVLARILSLGSLRGIGDLLRSDGIRFARAEIPFVRSGRTLTVKGGRAIGSIGITLDGEIDRGHRRIGIQGTVIPAYTLNTALGNVPLLGDLMTGGEGVFGVRYSVSGDSAKPDVDVTPLSALAPGVLRRMFFE